MQNYLLLLNYDLFRRVNVHKSGTTLHFSNRRPFIENVGFAVVVFLTDECDFE